MTTPWNYAVSLPPTMRKVQNFLEQITPQ